MTATHEKNHDHLPKNINHKYEKISAEEQMKYSNFKRKIMWPNVIFFILLHLGAFYGVYLSFFSHIGTVIWALFLYQAGVEGVKVAAHRYFTHKAFKATKPLELLLVIMQTFTGQNSIYTWVRDHRLHHKYTDTEADPHSSANGFIFSHIGWLVMKKHPIAFVKGKTIDMSDMESNGLVMFQKRHFMKLYFIIAVMIPVWVPMFFWNESLKNSFFIAYSMRYIIVLHSTWLINSAAHAFGMRPFDKSMSAVDNLPLAMITGGGGWHNYHHAFPWDYKAADLGSGFNLSRYIIESFALLGLAYDLRTAPPDAVVRRALRTGDGTYHSTCLGKDEEIIGNRTGKDGECLDEKWESKIGRDENCRNNKELIVH